MGIKVKPRPGAFHDQDIPYLADVILGNSDRPTFGNAVHLRGQVGRSLAKPLPGIDSVVLGAGAGFPGSEVRRIQRKKAELLECVSVPCGDWYARAGVSVDDLKEWMDLLKPSLNLRASPDEYGIVCYPRTR